MIMGMAVLTGAPALTRPTMIEVEVEEDWTRTVTRTPIMRPTTGFWRRSELENRAPMLRPPRILKESERKEREHTKKYRQVIIEITLPTVMTISFTLEMLIMFFILMFVMVRFF